MTDFETEYGFCKDNRLVLIVESLFAKSSTANAGAWVLEAPPSSPGAPAHLHLKQHTQNQCVLAHTLKVILAILTSYKNVSVGYIELKLHIYALGTSNTYFTSCKNRHNRSPLSRAIQSCSMFQFIGGVEFLISELWAILRGFQLVLELLSNNQFIIFMFSWLI